MGGGYLDGFINFLLLGTVIGVGAANYYRKKEEKHSSPIINSVLFALFLLFVSNFFTIFMGNIVGRILGFIFIGVVTYFWLQPSNKKSKSKWKK